MDDCRRHSHCRYWYFLFTTGSRVGLSTIKEEMIFVLFILIGMAFAGTAFLSWIVTVCHKQQVKNESQEWLWESSDNGKIWTVTKK